MISNSRRAASVLPLIVASVLLIGALVALAISSSESQSVADDPAEVLAVKSEVATSAPVINETQPAKVEPQESTPPVNPRPTKSFDPRTSSPTDGSAAPYSNAKKEKPPLEFEMTYLDIGIIRPGTFVENTIAVTNTSGERLTLRNISTGCKCTTAYLEGEPAYIEPYETLGLVIMTEAGFNLIPKSVSISIAVREYGSAVRFATKFKVSNTVAAQPAFLSARTKKSGRVTLQSLDGRAFRLLSFAGEPPVYVESDGFHPETDEPRTGYTVEWSYEDMDLLPRVCIVETDHPDCEIFALPIYSRERDKVELSHRRGNMRGDQVTYNLGRVTPGEVREITVKFRNAKTQDRMRGIFYESNDLQVVHKGFVQAEKPNETYHTFTLTVSQDIERGPFQTPMNFEIGTYSTRLWFYGVAGAPTDEN